MTTSIPGLLIAAPEPALVARAAASRMGKFIREAIRDRGIAHVALSGGSSPNPAYELLAKEPLDWCKVHIYWVDERAVPPANDRSNYGAAKKALLDRAEIPDANVHRMRAEASDLGEAAAEYETILRKTINDKADGGIPRLDLVVLGIGDDGHTASLFPGEPTMHVTNKLVCAVAANAARGREARMTLTSPVLENAHASVILVVGKAKHPALSRVWQSSGSLDDTPARIIRSFRGQTTWLIDHEAGSFGECKN
ncbi:MAG: 6-phosphogluconolactonase [Polyangiaceae bacterium]|nr:6-phosphogluconolactonase [Polyangiaceae bacterium]